MIELYGANTNNTYVIVSFISSFPFFPIDWLEAISALKSLPFAFIQVPYRTGSTTHSFYTRISHFLIIKNLQKACTKTHCCIIASDVCFITIQVYDWQTFTFLDSNALRSLYHAVNTDRSITCDNFFDEQNDATTSHP